MAEHTYTVGGPGVAVLYSIATNAADAVAKILRVTNQTQIAFAADGVTITPANEEDSSELTAFIEAALPPGTSTVAETARVRENGTSVGGGGATGGTQYILAVAGPVENKTGTNRKIWAGVVTLDPASGSWLQKAGEPTAPTLVFKSVTPTTAHTLGFAKIDAITAVDGTTLLYEMGSGDVTIPADTPRGVVDWVAKYTP